MNKNIFWFMALLMMFVGWASNEFLPDPQKLTKEITQLNQEFETRSRKRIDYLRALKESLNRNSVYGFIGGLIIGHGVGLSIDTLFKKTGSGYAIPLTVIGSALGCCAVQAYYFCVVYLIKKQSFLDSTVHSLKLIQKHSKFLKDARLALEKLEPEVHQTL